ncbi:ComEC/Rec2 family competence protein [Lentisphaerota bacterium WC36G]|nr:ComEC/Rec2 family competence protein [Lentisphaerae bacterium WC36]
MLQQTWKNCQIKLVNIIKQFTLFIGSYPAILILFNCVLTIFLGNIIAKFDESYRYFYIFAILLFVLTAISLITYFSSKIKFLVNVFLIFMVLGITIFKNNSYDNLENSLPNSLQFTAILEVTDYSACGNAISFLDNPKLVQGKIVDVINQNTPSELNLKNKKIFIKTTYLNEKLAFADKIKITGHIRKLNNLIQYQKYNLLSAKTYSNLDSNYQNNESGFYNYVKAKNICGIVSVSNLEFIPQDSFSIAKKIVDFRNFLINRLTKYLPKKDQKTLFCAMFFGIKQNLSREDKKTFIDNGIIHLFTVSGLHAAMVALIISLIFRVVPFRFRHYLIIFSLICYLIMTGSNPPALRAITMISTVLFFKSLRLKTPIINTLALTATFFLIFNPFLLTDLGFNYSFLVVFFLIIFSQKFQDLSLLFYEKSSYIAKVKERKVELFKARTLSNFFGLICGCIVAFLASSLVSINSYKAFFSVSILVNIILFPLVWAIYAIVAIQFLFCYSDVVLEITSIFNAFFIDLIFMISRSFSEHFKPQLTGQINTFELFIIAILLFLFIKGRKKISLTALSVILILISWNYFFAVKDFSKNQIIVISSNNSYQPSVIVNLKNSFYCTIINSGDYHSANFITNSVKKYAPSKYIVNYFTTIKKSSLHNAVWLIKNLHPQQIFLLQKEKLRSHYAKDLVKFCEQNNFNLNVFSKNILYTGDKYYSESYCYKANYLQQDCTVTKNFGNYSYWYDYNFNIDNVQFSDQDYLLEVDGLNHFGEGIIKLYKLDSIKDSKQLIFKHKFYSSSITNVTEIIF